METLKKYFTGLSADQLKKLEALGPIYEDWNQKINLISRKDMAHFYLRHVMHSLAIYKVVGFKPGASVMDVGTGGGFPGIPLAICNPDTNFLLVDSIGKKVKVVRDVVEKLGLDNVKASQCRVEEVDERFDFIVSRAVKPLPLFMSWVRHNLRNESRHVIPNGVLYLKGGDFSEDLAGLNWHYTIFELSGFFVEPFFATKKIVHIYR
ncbi:MAG: 16S rRNA (guanine(527)-N(7))-methyltransferase RsmG [Bacteroidales bacterium]